VVTGEEHVELVRRAFEAVFRRPEPDFETVNALFDPDHEFVSPTSELEGRSWRGVAGFREFLETWSGAMDWTASTIEIAQITPVDSNRVLMEGAATTRGKGSGLELTYARVYLVTVRGGKVVRTETFPSAAAAVEASGKRR
jgi:ketosteroid isomerase-like protein